MWVVLKNPSNISRVFHKINTAALVILQVYCRQMLMFHIPSAYIVPLGPGSIHFSFTGFSIYGPDHVNGILSEIDSFKRYIVAECCKKKKSKYILRSTLLEQFLLFTGIVMFMEAAIPQILKFLCKFTTCPQNVFAWVLFLFRNIQICSCFPLHKNATLF